MRSGVRLDDLIGEGRPRRSGPITEGAVGEHDEREAGDGIDPEESPGLAEVPKGRRRVHRARPVRGLVVADLEAEAEVARLLSAEPWKHSTEPGEDRRGRQRK